jgi:hypothetical protein
MQLFTKYPFNLKWELFSSSERSLSSELLYSNVRAFLNRSFLSLLQSLIFCSVSIRLRNFYKYRKRMFQSKVKIIWLKSYHFIMYNSYMYIDSLYNLRHLLSSYVKVGTLIIPLKYLLLLIFIVSCMWSYAAHQYCS